MASRCVFSLFFAYIVLLTSVCFAEDPIVNFEFVVSYITASPLGVPQQVCFQIFSFYSLCFLSVTLSGLFHLGNFQKQWVGLVLIFELFWSLASDL